MLDTTQFVDVELLGTLLIVGKVIKSCKLKVFKKIPNNLIPIIMCLLGVALEFVTTKEYNLTTFNYGVYTGLVSIGIHQVGKQIYIGNVLPTVDKKKTIKKKKVVKKEEEELT